MRKCGKILYSRAGQMTVWCMRIACWVILKICNTYYLLLFHTNNGCTNALQYHVIRTFKSLEFNWHGVRQYYRAAYKNRRDDCGEKKTHTHTHIQTLPGIR